MLWGWHPSEVDFASPCLYVAVVALLVNVFSTVLHVETIVAVCSLIVGIGREMELGTDEGAVEQGRIDHSVGAHAQLGHAF